MCLAGSGACLLLHMDTHVSLPSLNHDGLDCLFFYPCRIIIVGVGNCDLLHSGSCVSIDHYDATHL